MIKRASNPLFSYPACDTLFRSRAVHFKDNLGTKSKRICGSDTLAMNVQKLRYNVYGVLHRHAVFIIYRFRSHTSHWFVMPSGIGVRYHTAKVFTGSSRAVKFEPAGCGKNSSSFPHSSGERNFFAKLDSPKPYTEIAYETKTTNPTDDAYKKVSMMNNGKHNDKGNKLSRLSNLHIIWVWAKRLMLAALAVATVGYIGNSGIGIFLAVVVAFLIIRSLIRLAVRVVVTLVYIAVLLLILGLIIL